MLLNTQKTVVDTTLLRRHIMIGIRYLLVSFFVVFTPLATIAADEIKQTASPGGSAFGGGRSRFM